MTKINNFEKLLNYLTSNRIRASTNSSSPSLLRATESDKGRVINAAAFRRLQQKAQVFPLDSNAAVRTRLTHSIEVSQLGRYIAQKVIELSNYEGNDYDKLTAFVNTVETACLLHDIGNPPFGHLGEAAIREWFSEYNKSKKDINNQFEDLINFDGNPQGFRLATFLSGHDQYGLNLTSSLLLSIVKYPCYIKNKNNYNKIGLFQSNIKTYEEACKQTNWDIKYKKFPLMYLMDTADEIAYSISDLEDGLEKKIITEDQIKEALEDHKNETIVQNYLSNTNEDANAIAPFIKFKTSIINKAVTEAAQNFIDNLEEILQGADNIKIFKNKEDSIFSVLNSINNFARMNIYSSQSAEKVELAGRSVIKGLLNHFGELLKFSQDDFQKIISNDRTFMRENHLEFIGHLYNYLPLNYRYKYITEFEKMSEQEKKTTKELNLRAHMIVDFISGMTDDFALETYQILEGIRIE